MPVAARDEVGVGLRDAVRRQRVDRRRLALRRFDRLAEDLRRRRLVEADRRTDLPDRLEQRRDADRGELGCQHRLLPRHRHERDRREVVHLVRRAGLQRARQRDPVVEVGLDQLDAIRDRGQVRIRGRRRPGDTGHLVPLRQQELGEQRAVLAADPGDERAPRHRPIIGRCQRGPLRPARAARQPATTARDGVASRGMRQRLHEMRADDDRAAKPARTARQRRVALADRDRVAHRVEEIRRRGASAARRRALVPHPGVRHEHDARSPRVATRSDSSTSSTYMKSDSSRPPTCSNAARDSASAAPSARPTSRTPSSSCRSGVP